MLKWEDINLGDIIQYYDVNGKPCWSPHIVTELTDHSDVEENPAKYVTFVTIYKGRIETGALSDRGEGVNPSLDGYELRIVGHTDLADRLADTFKNTIGWMGEQEVA